MANYLEDLSLGLRQAAGVLNPQVSRDVFQADEAAKARREQFQLAQQSPQAQLARQQLENELGFRQEVSKLGPNPDPGGIASAAMKWGKPEVAANLYKAAEDRAGRLQTAKDNLEARKLQITATHEAAMARITDQRTRDQETARHNRAIEGLTGQLRDIQAQQAQAKIDQQEQGKPLPTPLMNQFVEKGQILDSSERFRSTFKDDYGGFASDAVGNAVLQAERKNPFSQETARTQWWQDYELHQSVIRNKLFGSALTAPEIAAWERSAISPGMNPANIKANLTRREMIERQGVQRLAKAAGTQYNKTAIREALGRDFEGESTAPTQPQAPEPPAGFKVDKP